MADETPDAPDLFCRAAEAARAHADAAALRTPDCPAPLALLRAYEAGDVARRFPHASTCPGCQRRLASFARAAAPPVPFTGLPRFPRRLVETLLTDLRRGRTPEIEPYERTEVDAWLCRVIVREQTFAAYLRRLKKWLPKPDSSPELAATAVAAVLARGPGAIPDPTALANLLLSPNQLTQLRIVVAAQGSPFWDAVADHVAEWIGRRASHVEQAQEAALAGGVRAIAATVEAWKPGQVTRSLDLLGGDGAALKADILAHYHDDTADLDELDEPFGLTLHADAVPGDANLIRLRLTASPAPVLAPLELALTLLKLDGAPSVKFVVPAYTDGRREASSGSSDPLPRAAFEFAEGTWENQLPLRLSVRGSASPGDTVVTRLTRELTFSSSVRLFGQ